MSLQKPTYQLMLDLDLPEGGEAITDDERIRSEAARSALDSLFGKVGAPRWLDEYLELTRGGWPWRVAAYIAWASTPRVSREPKTQDLLAREYLGLNSDRVISTWRKRNPAIEEMIRQMQASPLFKHRAEIFNALVAVAVKPEYKSHNDRKLAFELMGDYVPASKAFLAMTGKIKGKDLSKLSIDELMELAASMEDENNEHAEN
ncbi:MAG: hypothetical protein CVU44_20965 [Chloroflexi bacterium HGW-Chloroflexi-6]|nr:MAG: hypothetical protein CVU44_20965 [Chloroflexi bacterium HGW-Chloroflexi-6]